MSMIRNSVGESQDAFINIFKPAGLDTISDRSKLSVDVKQVSPDDDLLYDVTITDEQGRSNTIVLSVVGDNGSFHIDSISNPDYN